MSDRKLLIGPPREPDPAEFWRTATWMLAVFSLFIGGTLGFALGNTYTRDRQQAEWDADYYRELAEGCKASFNRVAFDASYAGYYTLSMGEVVEAFLGQHPQPSVEWTAAVE